MKKTCLAMIALLSVAAIAVAASAQDGEIPQIDTDASSTPYTLEMEHDETELQAQAQEPETVQTPPPPPPPPPPPAIPSSPPPSQVVDPTPVICNCAVHAPCAPGRKFDGYFIPRYMIPFTPGVGLMSGDVEAGWIWGKGLFFGIEAGVSYYITDNWDRFTGGIGFNWGAIRELPQIESQVAYGVFTGFWNLYDWKRTDEQVREVYQSGSIGPFARLRWRGVEFSYRGIIGYKQIETYTYTYGAYYSDSDIKYDGFGIIHQFMIGLHYFDSSKKRN